MKKVFKTEPDANRWIRMRRYGSGMIEEIQDIERNYCATLIKQADVPVAANWWKNGVHYEAFMIASVSLMRAFDLRLGKFWPQMFTIEERSWRLNDFRHKIFP